MFVLLMENIMNNSKEDELSEKFEEGGAINVESESPINLTISKMTVIDLEPLIWHNYDKSPEKLKVMNTGRTLIVNGKWQANHPFLTGGPLSNNYIFSQFHFHWGPNEMIGSEHYVDSAGYPMELHAVHFNDTITSQEIARQKENGIIIVVYFFKLQSRANETLNNIVQSLPTLKRPNASTRIAAEPISNILRPFSQNYFFYNGLLIEKNDESKVMWLVSRRPIGISINQIAEFRKLNNTRFKSILNNCKPLKDEKHVKVFHVNPSGSTHASLLPIFQDE